MKVNIGKHECTELWDGVLYKVLSEYPKVCDNEMKDIIDFVAYNKMYGREVKIIAEPQIFKYVTQELNCVEKYKNIPRPKLICECRACPVEKGCDTEFVCHVSPIENSIKIFDCGSLLSAIKARRTSAEMLMKESRNAANDTADMFEYIMFAWGNCQAGDRLVTERKLQRLPTAADLGENFIPGVRYYFRYDKLKQHPRAIHDGVLPIKVKDEIVLRDWVHSIIVPEEYRNRIESHIPSELKTKVHYMNRNGEDIWQWSHKVFRFVKTLNEVNH